jgi:hypothetical protein
VVYIRDRNEFENNFFVLDKGFLFCYKDPRASYPYELVCIEGLYTDVITDCDQFDRFGIRLTFVSELKLERIFYVSSRASRDEWIIAINRAMAVRVIEDYYEIGEKIGQGKYS